MNMYKASFETEQNYPYNYNTLPKMQDYIGLNLVNYMNWL